MATEDQLPSSCYEFKQSTPIFYVPGTDYTAILRKVITGDSGVLQSFSDCSVVQNLNAEITVVNRKLEYLTKQVDDLKQRNQHNYDLSLVADGIALLYNHILVEVRKTEKFAYVHSCGELASILNPLFDPSLPYFEKAQDLQELIYKIVKVSIVV